MKEIIRDFFNNESILPSVIKLYKTLVLKDNIDIITLNVDLCGILVMFAWLYAAIMSCVLYSERGC